MNVLIFSAGFGNRLKPYTLKSAKPAIPFLGIPTVAYPLFLAESLTPSKVIFNTHHLPESLEKAVASVHGKEYQVEFSQEQPEILNSGGGIFNARDLLGDKDPFLTINGDTVSLFSSDPPLRGLLEQHNKNHALATLLVQEDPRAGTTHGGVYVKNDNLNVDHFSATGKLTDLKAYHYLGVMALSPRVYDFITPGEAENILYDVLHRAIGKNEIVQVAFANGARSFETGNSKDYLKATRDCLSLLKTPNNSHGDFLKNILERFNPNWKTQSFYQIEPSQINTDQAINTKLI